jgi:serine/threonine protein kinase
MEFVEKKGESVGKKGKFKIHTNCNIDLDFIDSYNKEFTDIINGMKLDECNLSNAYYKFYGNEGTYNESMNTDILNKIKTKLETMINVDANTKIGAMNDIYLDNDDGFVLRIMKNKKTDPKPNPQSEYNSGYIQTYLSQQCETVPKIYAIGMYSPPDDPDVSLPFQLMEYGGTELFTVVRYPNKETSVNVLVGTNDEDKKINLRKSFIDCINTIQCMHSNGIVHRDIKPENITVTKVKDESDNELNKMSVIDYGFSNNNSGISFNNIMVGSRPYMPSELKQLFRRPTFDFFKQCDVYALALVLLDLENMENILKLTNINNPKIGKIHTEIDKETGIHKNIFKKYISILNPEIHTIENFLNDFKIYVLAMDTYRSNVPDPIQLPETSKGGKSQIKSKKKNKNKRRKTVKRKKRIHKKNTK